MMPRRGLSISLVGLVTGVLAAGCTGQIGSTGDPGNGATGSTGSGAGSVPPNGSGSGSSTGSGGKGTTGSGGNGKVGTGSGGSGTTGSGGNGTTGSGSGGTGGIVATGPRDPGRVTIRRLNRVEYNNTVRDLLGTAQAPATMFPDDAPDLVFDNNGDLQTVSPVQFSLYQSAAEALAAEVMTVGSKQRAQIVTCDLTTGAACARTLITNLGLKAFRRPLASTEVDTFVALMATAASAGATADEQFRTVLEAMLVSPNFLFHVELDPTPTSLTPHILSPYEMASRLSYMIYRSMPDQTLFDAAAAGSLAQPSDVQAQLQRMLVDAKSAFAKSFTDMWLGLSVVGTETFDATLFPSYSAALGNSMGLEVMNFFNEFVQKNNPIAELLTANYSYIDNNLAKLYGVANVTGTGVVRTTLNNPQRSGLLTMAGVLAVTSYPTRTSVVKRGAYVLSQLLCAPVPAPPADVPPFPEGAITATTQKEILAQHRTIPSCATCHDSMDNIGIAMENYDAIGAYRTTEDGMAVDSSGMFAGAIASPSDPSGASSPKFTGAVQLGAAVANDPRFLSCVAQNVMSYALGRTLSLTGAATDQPYLADIIAPPQTGSAGVRDVLMNVVASETFRMRRGDPTTSTGGTP